MQETDLLRAVLHYSTSTILIGSSLRNSEGTLTDFRILFSNRHTQQTTGRLATEIISHLLGIDVETDQWLSVWQQAIDVVETGLARDLDSQFTDQLGELRWFSVALRRYEDGIYAAFADITACKQNEQRLQRKIDELLRSNQNLERFAYVASHDLQEPLRKLIGFGEILQNQYSTGLSEQGVKLIQRMQSATQRMHVLIKDLLGFSRLASARDSEPFQRIDLQAVVNTVIGDLEPVIREKKAILDITSLPYLEGDATQLGQLFQNLLSNALKFTRPGDIPLVRIDCEVISGAAIQPMPGTTVLASDRNRSFFAITVGDNGIGFDEKYLDRIFTIFQRLHTRTDYPGTGIGLAVVQKVVENHKGYLNARSQPGQGADFIVYLPDEPAQSAVTDQAVVVRV